METEQTIKSIFAKAARLYDDASYIFESELEQLKELDGANRFKKMALGIFGKDDTKSQNEMVDLLHRAGIASSLDDGEKILEKIAACEVEYSNSKKFRIERVNGLGKEKDYHIYVC